MEENENAKIIENYLKRLGYTYEKSSKLDGEVVFTYLAVVPASKVNESNMVEYPIELVVPATDGMATSTSWVDLKVRDACRLVAPEVVLSIINCLAISEQSHANGCEESFTYEGSVLKCIRKVPTARLRQEFGTFIGRCAIMLDTLLWQMEQLDCTESCKDEPPELGGIAMEPII